MYGLTWRMLEGMRGRFGLLRTGCWGTAGGMYSGNRFPPKLFDNNTYKIYLHNLEKKIA
jgi:hypothetical protein